MKSLSQLCVPRKSVFDVQRRDTVLDLMDLVGDRIQPADFFEENYMTEGMKTLLDQGFRRLEGKSDQGIFKLKQAMGGGKTHNLLTLGLLARHPQFRPKVMGRFYTPDPYLGPVKVVAFSGRESDAPFGIWGAIAEQLGKKEHFKNCYAPLQASGQKAWVNLLAGETVLILLDELPPYFENARSRAIGNSDLAQVTATALSNLLVALGKEACARVCLVLTDLAASYQSGSQKITSILADFENETHRTAMTLEPVRMNSDELYHILRTRLFEKLPTEGEVLEKLATAAWYLHSNRDGKLFFKNVQNLNAKLESLVKNYIPEQAIKELRTRLDELFKSVTGWCYQHVLALPAIDEIELEQDRVTLVITEPHPGIGLRKELKEFYDQATWKNRVGFLTGPKDTYDQLIDTGKRLKAIQHILDEMKADKVPDSDPQMVQATELADRIRQSFHSAVRETFTTLWYPIDTGLVNADFRMKFEGNKYSGEQQVIEVLREKAKFTDEVSGDTFRKKCEQRLFTTQSLPWNEIKKRAVSNPKWQWHRPDALDHLKADCPNKDIWRKAVRYALTENPVTTRPPAEAVVPEFFRRASAGPLFGSARPTNTSEEDS